MPDFYYGPTSGIHSMFDQEFAEFARPKYEAYLRRALTPPANTPEEEMKAGLVAQVTKEVEQVEAARKPEGVKIPWPTDSPQRPPVRRRLVV